mgnify:CR=1 FL=1
MTATRTTILDASGQWWASSKPATERTLGRLDGVVAVEANPRQQGRGREVGAIAADVLRFYGTLMNDTPYPAMTIAVSREWAGA